MNRNQKFVTRELNPFDGIRRFGIIASAKMIEKRKQIDPHQRVFPSRFREIFYDFKGLMGAWNGRQSNLSF